jgi:hypothetical protein
MTGETPVARIFRELRAFRLYDGPSEVHLYNLSARLKREWTADNPGMAESAAAAAAAAAAGGDAE